MSYGALMPIPCSYPTVPDGFTIGWQTPHGVQVLCDPGGTVVAIWDEGRWWTPKESDRFVEALTSEIGGES
jgi:hypothetical protein